MANSKIDIKAESFPWQIKFLGVLFVIGGIAVVVNVWWVAAILWFLSLVIFTAHSGTEINRDAKTYREYNSYLFIRTGDTESYRDVERIFINSGKESQTVHTAHTNHSETFTRTVYNAYLKFDNGTKIFLTSMKKKDQLIEKLKPIAGFLETELVDYAK